MKTFGLSLALCYCHFWLYNELKSVSLCLLSEKSLKTFPISNWIIIAKTNFGFVFGCLPKKSQSRPINFLTRNVEFVFFSFLFDSLMSYSFFYSKAFSCLKLFAKNHEKIQIRMKMKMKRMSIKSLPASTFSICLCLFLRRKLNNYRFEKVKDDLKF